MVASENTFLEGVAEGFRGDGHAMVRGVLTGSALRQAHVAASAAVERILAEPADVAGSRDLTGWRQEDYIGAIDLHRQSPALREVVCSPKLARLAAAVLGVPAVRLLYDQLFAKPPGARPTPWHQDEGYWPVDTSDVIEPDRVGTVRLWLTLTTLPATVGGLLFVDGSHRCGAIDLTDVKPTPPGHQQTYVVDGRELSVTGYGAMEAGDATLHAGYTVHGSRGNRSTQTRYGITVAYVPDGARVAEPADPLQAIAIALHTPGKRPGELIDGPENPVLWSTRTG